MCVNCIVIEKNNAVMKINIDQVLFIERRLRKLRIVTDETTVECYERIENIRPYLDDRFFACLQGCYINFDKVKMMQGQEIVFENGETFFLGRTNFLKTRRAYKNYMKNVLF